jgi:purine-binding chemotaxis protein CheW
MSDYETNHTNGFKNNNAQVLELIKQRASTGKENQQREVKRRFLLFKLENDWYGVEATSVREISRVGDITRVPLTREYILGVINLRGIITAVMDVRPLLGLQQQPLEPSSRIIVFSGEGLEAGIVANQVAEVVDVPESAIEQTLSNVGMQSASYTIGSFTVGEKTVSIVDVGNLLVNLKI